MAWLALRDFAYEARLSVCFVLAMAAVLGPVLVLFGLRYGVVDGMVGELARDPSSRQITPRASGRYDRSWFAELERRPEVAFLIPQTRHATMAAALLGEGETPRLLDSVDLVPSAAGDPLLGAESPPIGFETLVLSPAAAEQLRVRPGDRVKVIVGRHPSGVEEETEISLRVSGLSLDESFDYPVAFMSLSLLEAIEAYKDGAAWADAGVERRHGHAGFRLYARTIYDVEPLARELTEQDIPVSTNADQLELVQFLDRSLGRIFWIVTAVAGGGFLLALAASLWASVDRKRRELSVLRLLGFSSSQMVLFPIFQSVYTALCSSGIALLLFSIASISINEYFASLRQHIDTPDWAVCRLLPVHMATAVFLTVAGAVLASFFSARRVAQISPAEGLRQL
jgi:putative ABC transport system permease protein